MKTPIKTLVLGSSLVCLVSLPTLLQAADEIEIIITAGRKAQTTDAALAAVSVITREQIEASQATSVLEVLQQAPGISVKNSGGLGKLSSVSLRGTNPGHVLVLLDGVKVGSATAGTTAFEYLPLDQVERIEIVRGPRSSLYGSEAIGGVIQIFTRKGSGTSKGFVPQASISYGSNNTRKASAGLSANANGSWFNLNAATVHTDGINVQDSYTDYPPPNYAPTTVFETDKDGFDNTSFSVHGGHRFENGATVELSVLRADGSTEFDGGYQNETDFKQQVISAKVAAPVSDNITLSAQVGQSRDEQDSFKDGSYRGTFDTQRDTLTLQADTRLGEYGSVTLGVDHQKDKIKSETIYDVDSRKNNGVFASYQASLGENKLDVSARHDDNEQFGKKTTGGIALGHDFGGGINGRISYGTAFKAPNFNELYYPGFSNADLKPENSRNLEIGVDGRVGDSEWSVSAFQNKIDDLIVSQDVGGGIYLPSNVDAANIRGLELGASTRVADWRLAANATLQKPEIDSGANQGNTLAYRPERILNLDVDRSFGAFSLGASVHAESERQTDAFNSGQLPGFATLDLRSKYQINRDLSAGVKVGNVLDKEYELNRGYNQDGVNAMLTLDYQPR